MWQKNVFIIFLFYLFVILQNSFFVHFSFFGAVLNLDFILFFCLVFFNKQNYLQLIFFAAAAGIFLDIFWPVYMGTSIAILFVVGFLLKKIQLSLKETKDRHPFVYFVPLFIIAFLAFQLLLESYFWFFNNTPFSSILSLQLLAAVIYNLLAGCLFFYVFKRCKFET